MTYPEHTQPAPSIAVPLISVGIVTFNRRLQVDKAIRSVIDQRRVDVEIVVVDNHSTDGTAEHIAAVFPQVRLFRMPRNVGCPDGRNHVYANCLGELIVNLDDDGWLANGVFESLVEVFLQDTRIGIVALRQAYPDDDGETGGRAMSTCVQDVTLFGGGVSAFRRSMIEKIGGFPADFFLFAEETYLSLRALDNGYRIVSAPHIVMWHPRVGGSHRGNRMDFHLYRNNLCVLARLYPLHLLLIYLPMKAASLLVASIRRRSFVSYVRALLSVAFALPRTLGSRHPVSPATVRKHLSSARHWTKVAKDGKFVAVRGTA
jgi:GT2 family glycosyltransferase